MATKQSFGNLVDALLRTKVIVGEKHTISKLKMVCELVFVLTLALILIWTLNGYNWIHSYSGIPWYSTIF